LILLHGYTDTSRSFQRLIEELNKIDNGFRIIAPDLRGHGDSSMPNEQICAGQPEACFTFDNFATDIIDLMDQLGIPRADIVGHSMGSMVAQKLALRNEDRVNSLTLISTWVNGKVNVMMNNILYEEMLVKTWKPILMSTPAFRWPADAYLKTPNELGTDVTDFLREYWVSEACADQPFLDAIYPETININIGTWTGALINQCSVNHQEALKKLKVPTLILWATQDAIFLQSDQQLVKAAFREAARCNKVRVVYKTYGIQALPENGLLMEVGHNLHWAAPVQVAEDIVSFVRNGSPINNLPHANPENVKEILVKTGPGVEEF